MYNIVSNLQNLLDIIDLSEVIFADTETKGLYGEVRSIQLYQEHWEKVAFIDFDNSSITKGDVIKVLHEVPKSIWHNVHYDLTVLGPYAHDLIVDDTFLLSRLKILYSDKYSLDYLLEGILGYCPYESAGIDKKVYQKMDWSKTLSEKQIIYACLDVYHLPKLYNHVKCQADTQSYKLDMHTLKHCLHFQRNGMPVDPNMVLYEKLKAEAAINAYDLPVNSNSYTQVREHLGVHASDEEFLMRMYLAEGNEDAYKIVKNRKHKKTLNFLDRYSKDRVYGYFKPSAKSGRLTSNNDNLQQIPRHLKTIFGHSKDSDYVLVFADYAQLELRTICALLKVNLLEELFRAGVDVHSHVAHMLFGDIVTKKDRTVTKTYNFNLLYGGSANMVCSILIKYGLLLDPSVANKHKRKWLSIFPEIAQWQRWCTSQWRNNETYSTPLGRRYAATLMTDFMNIRNQGAGAEVAKLALHYLYRDFLSKEADVKLCNFVHDSYILSCHKDHASVVANVLADCMLKAWVECSKNFKIPDLPMPVEVKVGKNWGEIEADKNIILTITKEV